MIAERLPLAIVACCILQLPGCFAPAQGYAPWLRPMHALLASQETYPTNGLVSYWSMRTSGTTVYDEWGSNDGTAVGSPTFSSTYGKRDDGARFTTTPQRITISSHIANFSALSQGSISLWVNGSSTSQQNIIGLSDGGDAGSVFVMQYLTLAGSMKLRMFVRENVTTLLDYRTTTEYPTGQWHHVVYTSSSSGNAVFVNGQKHTGTYAVGNASSSVFFGVINDADTLYLAQSRAGDVDGFQYSGSMDEVAIWNRALTSNEVHQIYSSPLYLDYKE
jgi:hypothetical protein